MKDDRLEKEFGEYFKGVKTPDNITDGAKKYVKKKSAGLPAFAKFASIAASFVLVAVAVTVIFFTDAKKTNENNAAPDIPDASDGNNSASGDGSADNPDSDDAIYSVYSDDVLTTISANIYTLSSVDPSLEFLQNIAYKSNAQVASCTASYRDDSLSLIKAEVTILGEARYDSEIYVEFDSDIYQPLETYLYGITGYYNGATYRLTRETADNGEPIFKLFITYNGLKYYVNVSSSDEECYIKYLQMIVK